MAGTIPSTRETKTGKLSFVLPEDVKGFIILSIDYRIEREDLPIYLIFLLQEARASLHKEGRTKMRKSEFFALFHPDQFRYFESNTVLLIRAHLGELIENPTKKTLPEQF